MYRVTSQFKATTLARFAAALHQLDDWNREPNWKEEECLFRALGYMKRGNFKLAEAELKELTAIFTSPPDKKAVPPDIGRERYTKALMKRGLAQLRGEAA
ncbi:MAG: hypothetical protein EPO10_17630 [Reyranella sp.]|uniref:hypothetical protein n=1 Tax=Reyranella sp. TaxID=1929291 RepID=UPI00120EF3A1|nr:hypothetical protein [Reyranella sp.]TAJ89114.1 MAG: hypothetical protein EPO41_19450 [Reyranella sp.]TBR27535.1 MAG: hypothetical protein EPO10_17630 [Reyranella sp.]